MKNELMKQPHLGDKHAIAEVRKRIMEMMPGAAGLPESVQWAAAQMAVAYKLNPFNGEIYIIPLGKKKAESGQWVEQYAPYVGVKGLRKLARRIANFMTEFRQLEDEEVKSYRRDLYDPADVGVEITLWRLDVAIQCKAAGLEYKPIKTVGFWRKKARFNKKAKTWSHDNIPETWTARSVAEKRAEVDAIKRAFDMSLPVADPSIAEVHDEIEFEARAVERDRAFVQRSAPVIEANGDMVFSTPHEKRVDRVEVVDEDAVVEAFDLPDEVFELAEQLYGDNAEDEIRRLVSFLSKGTTENIEDLPIAGLEKLRDGLIEKIENSAPASNQNIEEMVKAAVKGWNTVADAQQYAIEAGWCKNQHHARNAWKKTVIEFGGYKPADKEEIFALFAYDRIEKQLAPQGDEEKS